MKKNLSILTALIVLFVAVAFAVPTTSYASAIKLSKTSMTMYKGATYTIKISGTSKKAIWSSTKKSVASVTSSGKVTAKKPGTATIKAKISGKTYKCKVTVKKMITSNTAAKKAFKNYLANNIRKKWSSYTTFNNSNFRFICMDLGTGSHKVPTMFVWNYEACHADGYVGVYQYIGDKVKNVSRLDWIEAVFPTSGTFLICHSGGGYGEVNTYYYSTLNKKIQAKNKAFTAILDKKTWGSDYDWLRSMFGNDIYRINNKDVTKTKFNSYYSTTLKKTSSKIGENTLYKSSLKNTETNRNSYFK